jgi:hypothetical protein
MALINDHITNPVMSSQILVRWRPPEEGWVKLNTDGACKEKDYVGCGDLIRG